MTQAQTQTETKLYTFDEFIEWYPIDSEVRYELYDGVIVEMPKPRGKHSKLTGSLGGKLLTVNERVVLASQLRELLKDTQALHADNPLTDEEIAAEIEADRQGE